MGSDVPTVTRELIGRPSAGRRLALWAPVAAMLVLQVFLSSRSQLPPLPVLHYLPASDKVAHAGYFFLLGFLAYRAARKAEGWPRRRTMRVLILGALLWGISDEAHQSFVPGRDVEAADVAADVAGTALAALVAEPILRRLPFGTFPPVP